MNSVDSMQGDSFDQLLSQLQDHPQTPEPPGSKFSINCRSMLPKFDELAALCSNDKPDIICHVETWLCKDVLDSEIHIPKYSILRLDRNRHGGGIALYIHNSILSCCVALLAWNSLLCHCLELINFKLCIGVFYRPPFSSPVIFD